MTTTIPNKCQQCDGVTINRNGLCPFCTKKAHRKRKYKRRRIKYHLGKYFKNRKKILRELIREYGQRCFYCGVILKNDEVTLDHIIPVSQHGSHTKENLRISCESCNLKKANKHIVV